MEFLFEPPNPIFEKNTKHGNSLGVLNENRFIPYKQAVSLLKGFNLTTRKQYKELWFSNDSIRAVCRGNPQGYSEFTSIYDFLSIPKVKKSSVGVVVDRIQYKPYTEVLKFIKENNITSRKQWEGIKKPAGIPPDLNVYSKHGFRSYSFIFKRKKVAQSRFVSFERAAQIV